MDASTPTNLSDERRVRSPLGSLVITDERVAALIVAGAFLLLVGVRVSFKGTLPS